MALAMSQLASMNILTISIKIQLAAWLRACSSPAWCATASCEIEASLRYLTSYYSPSPQAEPCGILVTVVAPSTSRRFRCGDHLAGHRAAGVGCAVAPRPRTSPPESGCLRARLILAIYSGEMTRRIYNDPRTRFFERNSWLAAVEDFDRFDR